MIVSVALAVTLISCHENPPPNELLARFRSEFVDITPGRGRFAKSFRMGDATGPRDQQPAHQVTFQYDFAVARYELPQNLWEAVMGNNPSRWKGPRNSVEMVSWDESVDFCRRATVQMRAAGLITDKQEIRLPTESEWEYIARAGTTTAYSFGDRAAMLGDFAWFSQNASGNDPAVGAKKPNPWGLYDVHGYLWEWCSDHAHDDYQRSPGDGSSWNRGGDATRRVIRGGSWKDGAGDQTSANRSGSLRLLTEPGQPAKTITFTGGVSKSLRDDAIGFRCVLAAKRTE